jgi:deoxyadenosine/deoxycytidine kinase
MIYSIDGNISSGKSEILKHLSNTLLSTIKEVQGTSLIEQPLTKSNVLQSKPKVLIEQHANIACSTMSNSQSALLIEPVNKWSPGLKLFYKDKTNAFTLQMEILLWHLQNKNETGFIERSPLSCVHVFGESLRKDNLISEYQWTIMNEYYNIYNSNDSKFSYITTFVCKL